MRTFTGVAHDLMLLAVPRTALDTMHPELANIAGVHEKMEAHYLERTEILHQG